jgi:signal transduction histidine kinase
MTALTHEIIEIVNHLDEAQQRRLLEVAKALQAEAPPRPPGRHYTAGELMQLPFEERNRIAQELLAQSRHEDFEIFEAYDEEAFDESH